MANHKTETSSPYIVFVDVLYAVIIGETIFEYGKELFNLSAMSTIALIVTYISIISSFIFWHKAISDYPHKNPLRFFVDVFVLITYILMILDHSNIDTIFFGFIILYLLYLIWDFLTRNEYGVEASRLTTSFINLLLVIIVSFSRKILVYYPQVPLMIVNFGALMVLGIFIVVSQILDILRVSRERRTDNQLLKDSENQSEPIDH